MSRWMLTPRQDGVLGLLLQGYSNKEIARRLNLSPHTVKIHGDELRWMDRDEEHDCDVLLFFSRVDQRM